MATFAVQDIRNFAVTAHGGAGKTKLIETMLFNAGAIDRIGSVQEGTTVMDYEPEEIARKITVSTSMAYCDWKGRRFFVVDTPGLINFIEEAHASLRAVDGTVLMVSAVSGVRAETDKLWGYTEEYQVPVFGYINEMDKDSADFEQALTSMERSFKKEALPLVIPIGAGPGFKGVIDILDKKAYLYEGGKATETDIPAESAEAVERFRKKLVEKIVEADDNLMMIYLEGGEVDREEIVNGIRIGTAARNFVPVACGSASNNMGVDRLMDAIALCLPSPEDIAKVRPIKGRNPKTGEEVEREASESAPLSAFVFKTIADPFAGRLSMIRVFSGRLGSDSTIYNATSGAKERIGQVSLMFGKKQVPVQALGPGEIGVVAKLKETNTGDTLCDEAKPVVYEKARLMEPIISYAIAPKSKGDEEKVSSGLHRILEEDPTLRFHRDEETKEMIISGMGQLHLEVALEKLKRKFGVEVEMKTPKIPYRETITGFAKAQGRYKKQSGGKGQYGDCWIEVKPLPRGQGFEFEDAIVGGAIPRNFIPAVEKGIAEALREGIIAGYPMVDIGVKLYDGSYHPVDSSEMAFKIAGSFAIKKAAVEAKPVLLEPVMKVEIITPEDALGSVIGDLNSKRGKVQGMEQQGGNQKVTALVPMAELLTYANQLHSFTAGRGIYTMELSHYEQVPAHIAQKIIAEKQAEKQKEE